MREKPAAAVERTFAKGMWAFEVGMIDCCLFCVITVFNIRPMFKKNLSKEDESQPDLQWKKKFILCDFKSGNDRFRPRVKRVVNSKNRNSWNPRQKSSMTDGMQLSTTTNRTRERAWKVETYLRVIGTSKTALEDIQEVNPYKAREKPKFPFRVLSVNHNPSLNYIMGQSQQWENFFWQVEC